MDYSMINVTVILDSVKFVLNKKTKLYARLVGVMNFNYQQIKKLVIKYVYLIVLVKMLGNVTHVRKDTNKLIIQPV